MGLSRLRWVSFVGFAMVLAAPAWANYSWGAFTLFRPGVQLALVLLTLASETLVFRWLARVPWLTSALAVTGANLLSGLAGLVFMEPNYLEVPLLAIAFAVSCFLEAIVLIPVAESHRWRPLDGPSSHPWAALIVANLVSVLLCAGYVEVAFHGNRMPLIVRGRPLDMRSFAHEIESAAQHPDHSLRLAVESRSGPAHVFRQCASTAAVTVDIAPAWAPWAQLRTGPRYGIGEVPELLDPPGSGGRPLIWTGAPWVDGRRGVVFTDGNFRVMSEREFRQLHAVPRPLPQWLVQALQQRPPPGRSEPRPHSRSLHPRS